MFRNLFDLIIRKLNTGIGLAVAALLVALASLFVQVSDSFSSDEQNLVANRYAQSSSAQREAIVEAIEGDPIPVLFGPVDGTAADSNVRQFLEEHGDKVFELNLEIDPLHEDLIEYPDPPETEEENRYSEMLTTGCDFRDPAGENCEGLLTIAFRDGCPDVSGGKCIYWDSGFFRVRGFFTVVSSDHHGGDMFYVVQAVPAQQVRLQQLR